MPRSRASEARCEVEPPSSATTPPTRGRIWDSAGPATRVTRMSPGATRASSHSQLTTTARPEPQPMPAGWPFSRVLEPDFIRHMRLGYVQRPRLQKLETVLVERPFDLDRHAEHVFGLAHQPAKRGGLSGFETRRAKPALPAPPAAACRRHARRLRDDVCGRLRWCARNRGATARCGPARFRPARSRSRAPRWRTAASGLRRFRSNRRPRRARRRAAAPAPPSRCRSDRVRAAPSIAVHWWSTTPPSRRATR